MQVEHIQWNKHNKESMLKAQLRLNEFLINQQFFVGEQIKQKFKMLQDDLMSYESSTCSVCGNRQSLRTHMNIEHLVLKHSWRFESDYDTETHELTLCCPCYTKFIYNNLKPYIKIDYYM
jgi:hypothetical protein